MSVGRELRVFCRPPLGVPVEFMGVSTYPDDGTPICGVFDRPSSIGFGESGTAGIEQTDARLTLPFNAFDTMPQSGDAISVDGKQYTCNQPYGEDDGMMLVYDLLEAA